MKKLFFPLIAASLLFLNSCSIDSTYIESSGTIVKETREIRNFDGIEVNGNFEVHLINDNKSRVIVEGDANILDYVETYVSNGVLIVKSSNGYSYKSRNTILWVYAPDLYEMTLNGSGDIRTDNIHNFGDYAEINLNGSGDIYVRGDARTAKIKNTGSGDIRIEGNGRYITAHTSGSGDIIAHNFVTDEGEAKIWGSGDITLNIWRYISAEISGSGDIYYEGNPRIDAFRTGSGTIRRR